MNNFLILEMDNGIVVLSESDIIFTLQIKI